VNSPALGIAKLAILVALVPLSLLVQPQKADAILRFYIFEQGNTTKIKTIGSLTLPTSFINAYPVCLPASFNIDSNSTLIELSTGNGNNCSTILYQLGNSNVYPAFSGYAPSGGIGGTNDSNYVAIVNDQIILNSTYVSGDPINNDITFNNPLTMSLSGSTGIASWTIMDGLNSIDSVEIYLSPPPNAASVPAPLPLAGVAFGFGWSRKLRRRAGKAAFSHRG
jgi:hypothetical protein